MVLREGRNNWNNFGEDHLSSITVEYDGQDRLWLQFCSDSRKDVCEVTLDWVEEIKSFRTLVSRIYRDKAGECKLYPDDFRGLMMRAVDRGDEVELNFLKNYQAIRVIMKPEKAVRFWEEIETVFRQPARKVLVFEQR